MCGLTPFPSTVNSKLWLLLGCLWVSPTRAVFVASEVPNRNHSAPEEGAGWSSVARYSAGGAVYLGNGWFITAGHLGRDQTEVRWHDETYTIDIHSWKSATPFDNYRADVRLFRVEEPDAIVHPGVKLLKRPLEEGETVWMIGHGRDIAEQVDTETEIRYKEGSKNRLKWGTNTVGTFKERFEAMDFTSHVFETKIAPGQAQAVTGDSGGGVFVLDPETGEPLLAGIMVAAGLEKRGGHTWIVMPTDPDIPSASTQSVYLNAYHDRIQKVIQPTPYTSWMMWGLGISATVFLSRFIYLHR